MKRAAVILIALSALPLAVLWWVGSGLLAGSYDSGCGGSPAADLSFVAANVGFLLAGGALVAGFRRRLELAGRLLGSYAVLFVASLLVAVNCD